MAAVDNCDRLKSLTSVRGYDRRTILLIVILSVASAIRLFRLARSGLWYNEVMTMRLARNESPSALFQLLCQIDVYCHPLGLLIASALGLVSFLFRRAFRVSWRGWLCTYLAVALAVAPWLSQYLDHAPKSTSGLLPFRYLLGMPIRFIGGNFTVLFACFLLIN